MISQSVPAETLARCVGDVEAFGADVWGSRPIVVRPASTDESTVGAGASPEESGDATDGFVDVFSLAAIDDLLASSARVPSVRMVEGGENLPASQFCTTLRIGGRSLDDVVDPRKVVARLADGATLVLQSLHRTWPSVAAFVGRLQAEISHPCQANAYLTPPSASGLAEHADSHDVIALQLHGSKHWWVEGLGDITLYPGDSMYLPAGTRHRAATATETSLHLTIGIIRVTYRQVLERLLDDGPPEFDEPLPIGYRHDTQQLKLERGLDATLDRLLDLVGSADLVAVADRERSRRQSTPHLPGRIVSTVNVESLTLDSVIRWVASEPLIRSADKADKADKAGRAGNRRRPSKDDRVMVDLGDRTLTLPASTLSALEMLSTGSPVSVADLPGLDAPSRIVLASRLVREAACVIVELRGS